MKEMNNLKQKITQRLTVRKITAVFMYMIILALIGLFQAVVLGFDFSIYTQFDFYFRIGYRVILIILTFTSTINFLFDRTYNSEKVQAARQKYLSVVKMKDVSFKDFLDEYNVQLKKDAWINKINKEINKIERKMEHGKRLESLMKKREYYKSLITDEYINEHFDFLDVRYTKVYVSDFSAEDAYGNDDLVKTRSDFNGAMAKFNMRKIGQYILLTFLTGSVIYNVAFETGLSFWLNICIDLALVVTRIADAAINTPILVDLEYTQVYLSKTDIMNKYINWCSERKITESKAHKVLSYIESTEGDNNE